jgi:hypothetical protein
MVVAMDVCVELEMFNTCRVPTVKGLRRCRAV